MKKTYLMMISTFCFGMIVLTLGTGPAYAQPPFPVPPKGGLPACEANLGQVLPGDGYTDPYPAGVYGHGPALDYTDNNNGTFTDNNTKLMWEEKLPSDDENCSASSQEDRSVHCVNNTYTWSSSGTAADGTLFNGTNTMGTDFLYTLNNTCAGDETMHCTNDTDCTGIGNGKCGFAGYRDWRIPNIKELQSIVDYSKTNPAFSAHGAAVSDIYWSATTFAYGTSTAWFVSFLDGFVGNESRSKDYFARAVRP